MEKSILHMVCVMLWNIHSTVLLQQSRGGETEWLTSERRWHACTHTVILEGKIDQELHNVQTSLYSVTLYYDITTSAWLPVVLNYQQSYAPYCCITPSSWETLSFIASSPVS